MSEPTPEQLNGDNKQVGFKVKDLFQIIHDATIQAKNKLMKLKENTDNISIADMFEMQMIMNHLSQLSEMSTQVVSASNGAIQSMARNVKG